ncbi:hypothetical protein [Kitasatospora sp. LaBMicrA B282]|uniref:hypothetical protein n=1 Tax=Kitasatospora sp. LaBMicrA B282 TaxID=3420949 RepID=UPI003D124D77
MTPSGPDQERILALTELDQRAVDRATVRSCAARLMTLLKLQAADRAATPGGASWLYIQDVPARRLVTQLVWKLLRLSSEPSLANSPAVLRPAPGEGLLGLRPSSFNEYRAYTVTWSGVAYVLGADAERSPRYQPELLLSPAVLRKPASLRPELPAHADVIALTWSSRHWATLGPVLGELTARGQECVLLDLATEEGQRAPDPFRNGITVRSAPQALLTAVGTIPEPACRSAAIVEVCGLPVHLDRIEHLVVMLLALTAGATQPSWAAITAFEGWLDTQLAALDPHTLLVSNDISPLGALAVHTAERQGRVTVNVQHGAWAADTLSSPALHSRHLVVMGERDRALAEKIAHHPASQVHVLGQPRFDNLTGESSAAQRRYLEELLGAGEECGSTRLLLWACQPFSPERLAAQADLIRAGVLASHEAWSLAIAPHPAQSPDCFAPIRAHLAPVRVAVVAPEVGARGSLAGADALVTVASTCGLEAVLLGVPVLELLCDGVPSLRLATHGAATACSNGVDVARALDRALVPVDQAARDAVCYWRGTSSADIAGLIISSSLQRG